MKKITTILLVLLLTAGSLLAQVAINSDNSEPDASSMLDVQSTNKGFLPPRMTNKQIKAIPNPAEGLMVYNTDENKLFYYNGAAWAGSDGTATIPIETGDFLQGGVVFYLDGYGGGLICAVSDQSTSATWGCQGVSIPGALESTIGRGLQNTNAIVAICQTPGIAAQICADLSLNGYTDWFLPSQDELDAMYQNKAAINATAAANGGSDFANAYYWSSTEGGGTPAAAYVQNFSNGNQSNFTKDGSTLYVRAVRALTLSVTSLTGKTWMDRNLGASRVASSSDDVFAYGDLYQWGRAADGHQIRTSATTSAQSSSDNPGHGDFIIPGSSPYDWRSPKNDNLWQGVNGINNPCPSGYRLPTAAEWQAEILSWSSADANGAFTSPLILPATGVRNYSDGSLEYVGSSGNYWSATVNGTSTRHLNFGSGAFLSSWSRAAGFSVRCIKD
ncbi:MAG: DUF1566 domain-containing protein [Bacteroidales bacterium]|nr:DUF1566 domain-containing protein [Bacteroidales bacterium]